MTRPWYRRRAVLAFAGLVIAIDILLASLLLSDRTDDLTAIGDGVRVFAVGDLAGATSSADRVADMIGRHRLEALLTLGDHAYEEGTLKQFEAYYDPTFGRFNDIVYPTPGNHDVQEGDRAGYWEYFARHARGFRPDRPFYAFDLGGWRLYSLNSELADATPGSEMYQWLRADLLRRDPDCILAFWHKPVLTVGRKNPDEGQMHYVWDLLAAFGTEIVLSGHDHNYQRWEEVDGITSFVVGTGGRSRYPIEREDSRVAYATDSIYGALELVLQASQARFAFRDLTGRARDSGTVECSKAEPGRVQDHPPQPTDLTFSLQPDVVDLEWQAPEAQGEAVAGYLVFRGDDLVGFTTQTRYADNLVPPPGNYIYQVRSVTASGARSTGGPRVLVSRTDAGITGSSYRTREGNPSAPTADKPQSKLWWHDGSWWGILFNPTPPAGTRRGYFIHRLDPETQAWVDTGVPADDRSRSEADALWVPETGKLYVASVMRSGSSRLYRYTYADGAYNADAGFPVRLVQDGAESITLARDSTGTLWATVTQRPSGGQCIQEERCDVLVAHTLGADWRWSAPAQLPFPEAVVHFDDISAVVAFGDGLVGVMWSNQLSGALYFASRRDGAPVDEWALETIRQGVKQADDHLNLKVDSRGQLFAVFKTGLNDVPSRAPTDPLVIVAHRDSEGAWRESVFGTVADDHTRPQLILDETQGEIYVFAATPGTGGAIVFKRSPTDAISFEPGLGEPVIVSGIVNNVSTTKHPVSAETGIVVLASDDAERLYWHSVLDIEP